MGLRYTIDSKKTLGLTHSHEHIYVSSAGLSQIYPERVPKDYVIKEAVDAFIEPIINGFWFYFLLVFLKSLLIKKK